VPGRVPGTHLVDRARVTDSNFRRNYFFKSLSIASCKYLAIALNSTWAIRARNTLETGK